MSEDSVWFKGLGHADAYPPASKYVGLVVREEDLSWGKTRDVRLSANHLGEERLSILYARELSEVRNYASIRVGGGGGAEVEGVGENAAQEQAGDGPRRLAPDLEEVVCDDRAGASPRADIDQNRRVHNEGLLTERVVVEHANNLVALKLGRSLRALVVVDEEDASSLKPLKKRRRAYTEKVQQVPTLCVDGARPSRATAKEKGCAQRTGDRIGVGREVTDKVDAWVADGPGAGCGSGRASGGAHDKQSQDPTTHHRPDPTKAGPRVGLRDGRGGRACLIGSTHSGSCLRPRAGRDPSPSESMMVPAPAPAAHNGGYVELVALYREWRAIESPPPLNGAPNYTEAHLARAYAQVRGLQARLFGFDRSEWSRAQQVDWHIVRAEMNGFDFNYRVLRPWARDPAFYKSIWTYQSDVPAHEGPTHHDVVELWTYTFPLSASEAQRLARELAVVPPLLTQARENLSGNARELWVAGIRDIEAQGRVLTALAEKTGGHEALEEAREAALEATRAFAKWLREESPKKTGPSGIGKDAYTWYLQNVHLVPLTWEDEVRLLERELDRAWSALKLEEHRNRALPPQTPVADASAYQERAEAAAARLVGFLGEQDVLPVDDRMLPVLRRHLGGFVPEATRNFFWITAHLDPTPLYTHFYHWWDLDRMATSPHESPMREVPLLYNIFDSRAEGTATGVEEMFLHAGLYDQNPRSRELVWIMLAQRAARGLGSLRAHANEITMAEAGKVHVEWTPRGWMRTEPELLQFEQHLYLRQPGYGTSYVTGKYLMERLLAVYAKQLEQRGEDFSLSKFFRRFNATGVIPMSLIQFEMTGPSSELDAILGEN